MAGQTTFRSSLPGAVPGTATRGDRLTITGMFFGVYFAMFLSQFDLCMRLQGNLAYPPIYLLLATQVMLAVLTWYFSPQLVGKLLSDGSGMIYCFVAIVVMAFVGASLPNADLGEGNMNVIYPVLDFLIYFFAIPLAIIFRSSISWKIANGIALIAIVGSILIDANYPGTFSSLEARAAGFGVNPNRGAAISAILLIGVLDWQKPRISMMACIWSLLSFAGVFMTMSRSGILLLGLVGTLYLRQCIRRNGIGTLVVMSGLVVSAGSYLIVAADAAKSSLPLFEGKSSRANLFNGEINSMDTSDDARIYLIYEYLDMISQRPLSGHGTGFTESNEHGAHNIYLARWVDNGVVGVGAYLLLLGLMLRLGLRAKSWECIATSLFVLVYGCFTHNLLEQKNVLLFMAIVAGRASLNSLPPPSMTTAVLRTEKKPYRSRIPLAKAS